MSFISSVKSRDIKHRSPLSSPLSLLFSILWSCVVMNACDEWMCDEEWDPHTPSLSLSLPSLSSSSSWGQSFMEFGFRARVVWGWNRCLLLLVLSGYCGPTLEWVSLWICCSSSTCSTSAYPSCTSASRLAKTSLWCRRRRGSCFKNSAGFLRFSRRAENQNILSSTRIHLNFEELAKKIVFDACGDVIQYQIKLYFNSKKRHLSLRTATSSIGRQDRRILLSYATRWSNRWKS